MKEEKYRTELQKAYAWDLRQALAKVNFLFTHNLKPDTTFQREIQNLLFLVDGDPEGILTCERNYQT